MASISATDIDNAAKRLSGHVYKTPLLKSRGLSAKTGANVFLKLESEQDTGSFKVRGAYNKILAVQEEGRTVGQFVTASSGNHAIAVATALEKLAIAGTLVVPIYAEANKILALKSYAKNNIKIVNHGTDVTYSEQYARELEKKDKANVYISPYNDELVIAGQGTIACELVQQSPTPLDAVFVTVGGGGLVSGISIYLKNKWPDCKIIGCQPANSPVMSESIKKGYILPEDEVEQETTLSDGSEGLIEQGSITFGICKDNVDDWVTVTEAEIGAAMAVALYEHKKVIEGAAGVALAAFLKTKAAYKDKNVGIILCGSNVAPETLITQYKTHHKED